MASPGSISPAPAGMRQHLPDRVPEGEWALGEDFREEGADEQGDEGVSFMDR